MVNALKAFFTGNISRRKMTTLLLPIVFIVYYGTMFLAILSYPDVYDWRFMAISSIGDVNENPNGWYIFAVGIVTFSLSLIVIAGYLFRKLHVICQRTAEIGTFFILLAALGNFLLGVVLNIPENLIIHIIAAACYAIGLLFGYLCYWFIMMKDRLPWFHGKRQFNRRLMDWALVMILFSLGGIVISQGIRVAIEGTLDFGGLDWIMRGEPYILSFGVWEWVLYTFLNIHLIFSICMVPEVVEPLEPIAQISREGQN